MRLRFCKYFILIVFLALIAACGPLPTPSLTSVTTAPEGISNARTVMIEMAEETVDCFNPETDPICLFETNGTIDGTQSFEDLSVYIFVFPVNPVGCGGWYLQPSPATIEADGSWVQTPTVFGNSQYPVENGHALRVLAALVKRDAQYKGSNLGDLPADTCFQDLQQDLDGIVSLSKTVRLTIQR